MYPFKLQAACLTVIIYLVIVYLKSSLEKKTPCNRYYDMILWVSPLAVVFDGVTAWTVNFQDLVPLWVNLLLHALFFISLDLLIIISFLYMLSLTTDFLKPVRNRILAVTPGVISVALIIAFIGKTYFVHGKNTWYSMGPSVYAIYISLIFHFGWIFGLALVRRRHIDSSKFVSIITYLLISIILLIIQMVYPESLITALFTTILVLGFYVNTEDPSIIQLKKYNESMVTSFATLVESRDDSTGGHIKRTKLYVGVILDEMRRQKKYKSVLTVNYIENVLNSAPMHDIGKIATPDSILQKPGKLTDEEFAVMKQHSVKGGEILKETFAELEEPDFKKIAFEVARYHHEKWNGKGYPEGISGTQIPLHARIMAIADVFDAVSAKRCYRDAMPLDQCFSIIEKGAGTDFDPELADLFLKARDKVENIYNQNGGKS